MTAAYGHEQDERLARLARVVPTAVEFEPELPKLAADGSYAK